MLKRGAGLLRVLGVTAMSTGVIAGCAACANTSSEAWSEPSVSSRNSLVLTVMAQGTSTGDGACSPLVHLEATETASKVIVRASTSKPAFSNAACAAVLAGPRPFSITLKRALGDRVVVDARTGTTESVLDGSVLPTITGLPRDYVERSLFRTRAGTLTRSWSVHSTVSYPGVTLLVGPAGSAAAYPISKTTSVDGHKVAFWSDGGDTSQNFAATWTLKPGKQAQITVSAPTGEWTDAQTLALVAHTKRL